MNANMLEKDLKNILSEVRKGSMSDTQALNVLKTLPFEDLGFPSLEEQPLPEITWPYLAAVPAQIVIVGGLMTGIYFYTRRKGKEGKEEI